MFRRTAAFAWSYIRPHKMRMFWGYLCLLGSVWALGRIPDTLRRGLEPLADASGMPRSALEPILLETGVAIVILALMTAVCTFGMRVMIIGVSRMMERDLRMQFFRHLTTLDFLTLNRLQKGDLVSRATADIEGARMLMGPAIMHFSHTAMLTPIVLYYMFDISWVLTLLSLIPLVIVTFTVRRLGPQMHRLSKRAQERLGNLSTHAQESFAGIHVVQAFAREEHESGVFRGHAELYRESQVEVAKVRGMFIGIITSVASLGILTFVLFTPGQVMNGTVGVNDAIAFLAYIEVLVWPMIAFGWTTTLFQRGAASVERLQEIFARETIVAEPAEPQALETVQGEYRFDNVEFAYDPGVPVLKGVDLTIPKGATVAIMGPIGSGKTTLVRLLLRLFDPQQGTVRLDGVDLRALPMATVRGAIGYAPQDGFMFSETIARNVAFSLPNDEEVPRERLQWAAEVAQLSADLDQFPHGLDTMVGERGISLSGGQRQRAALARALMADAPVLILDDTFSAVDTHTEEAILERLKDVMKERTTILVAHRVSTVRYADQIVVMENGHVTAQGTDEELMAQKDGYYARIARRQRLTAEIEAM